MKGLLPLLGILFSLVWIIWQILILMFLCHRISNVPMCIGDCSSLAEVIFLVFPPNLWFSVVGGVHDSAVAWQTESGWIISHLFSAVFFCAWPSFYAVQVDLSSNLLTDLPVTFGDLLNLKVPSLFMFSLCYSLFSQFCDTSMLEVNSNSWVFCPCIFASTSRSRQATLPRDPVFIGFSIVCAGFASRQQRAKIPPFYNIQDVPATLNSRSPQHRNHNGRSSSGLLTYFLCPFLSRPLLFDDIIKELIDSLKDGKILMTAVGQNIRSNWIFELWALLSLMRVLINFDVTGLHFEVVANFWSKKGLFIESRNLLLII